MPEFTLEYTTCEEVLGRAVLISAFEDGSEQRREQHGRDMLGFRFTSTRCSLVLYQSYRTFYTTQGGELDGFTFTSPYDATIYNVRFNGEFRGSYNAGLFDCEWSFVVINEDEA